MPDPIRSALQAAALATMTASEREHADTCHNGQPGPGHIRRAAETVAACLTRLGDVSLPFDDGSGKTHIADYQLRMLAAAVERAAYGERAMNDPMKDALRAAGNAVAEAMAQMGMDYPDLDEEVPLAAAAVAAFLRALPDQYSRGGAGFWDAIPPQEETRLWLATAVERAARDE